MCPNSEKSPDLPPLPALDASPASDAAAAGAEAFKPGDVLDGRYVLQDAIGEGGVGLIFRAIQFKVQRPVAVKFLQRDMVGEQSLKPRFEREALTLAALAHPNIVRLQDYGIARGNPFLVMEFVEGRTLRGVLNDDGGFLPVPRALAFTRQMLYALAYAHERGIVHRDLKPANVIVQELPHQPEHLKILDFGFAKFLPGSELDMGGQLTRAGHTFGSPPYMSPEHATGSAVDGRADLYSVGILLFEMLTGTRPFEGEIHELLRHHLVTPPPRLVERRPELAAHTELQRVLDRAMAKRRDERYGDAGEFLDAIDALDKAADLEAALVTVEREPAGSAEPSFVDVVRVVARYAAAMLRHFERRVLPKLLAALNAGLERLLTWLRKGRQPPPV